jgi:hypothetical protein
LYVPINFVLIHLRTACCCFLSPFNPLPPCPCCIFRTFKLHDNIPSLSHPFHHYDSVRLLKEQVEVLESLTVKMSSVSSTLAARIESASEVLRKDEKTVHQNEINRKEEISVKTDRVASTSRVESGDERAGSSSSEKRRYQQSDEELRSRKEEEEKNDDDVEGPISSFFSNIMDNISGQGSEDSDSKMTNSDKSKKQKIKPGTAQQKRVNLARQSGRAIRDMGGALAKTAADTLGFWVGLGFDEVEIEDEVRDGKRRRERGGDSGDYQQSGRFEDYRSSSKIDDIRLSEEDFRAADYPPRIPDEVNDGSWTLPYSVGDDVYSQSLDSIAVEESSDRPLEMPIRGVDGLNVSEMDAEETEDFRFLTSDDDQINYNELD